MPGEEVPLDKLKELLSGVDPERLRQVMPLVGGGVITLMFTDIVDSTRITREVGDRTYLVALNRHNSVIRECIAQHAGHELKTIGDSFFIAFRDPGDALHCACQIQQALRHTSLAVGEHSVSVRIGLHTGAPLVFRDEASGRTDLIGSDVNKAARIESIARGGQVLISEQTRVFLDPLAVHDWGMWELKGLGSHRIFEMLYPGKEPELPAGRMQPDPLRFATSFIGRKREIAELTQAIKHHRLVTVTGMGGIGKTRLADSAARCVSDPPFTDGIFFVELAGTVDAEGAVVSKLAAALAVNQAGFKDEAAALLRFLQNRQTLIVLDNFEEAISAAPTVRNLLLGCPGVHFLVTSQTPLNVDGEQLYPASPMDVPAPEADASLLAGFDAFRLFRDRARLRVHDWDLIPCDTSAVAEILRLVDGIPLAIELAAAWADSKTLEEIRIGLAHRLKLLRRRGSAATDRHQSMRACLDYSFGLLSEDARTVLPRLAVFAGGFFVEDVEAVCGVSDADELLVPLHERSLLIRQAALGRSRYSMLGMVQEYAESKLPKVVARKLKHAHSRHFLEVLRVAASSTRRARLMTSLERIEIDLANFEAGIRESLDNGDHPAVVDYAALLADYLRIKGRFSDDVQLALAARGAAKNLGAESVAVADNNLGNAYVNLPTGDRSDNLRHAIECYEAALRVWTERDFPQDWAGTRHNLGNAYVSLPTGDCSDNLGRAIECYETALRVRTERDFPLDWAATQNNLGNAYLSRPTGDRSDNLWRAIECYEAALRVRTESDSPRDWAETQNNLGAAYRDLPAGDRGDNLRCAIECYEAALRVWTERDFPQDWATSQNNLGVAYANLPTGDRGNREANLRRAIECYEAVLRVWTEREIPQNWATAQNNLGNAYWYLSTGDPGNRDANLRRAIECHEAALRVRTERDFPQDWAETRNNLGVAYVGLPTGDRGDNIRRAIECYDAVLRVWTEREFSQGWATTQNNLGIAYATLPTPDRDANLRRAIKCFRAALRVRTERDLPRQWAETRHNLGSAYTELPTGDRSENLRCAIECYEMAARGYDAVGLTYEAGRARTMAQRMTMQLERG